MKRQAVNAPNVLAATVVFWMAWAGVPLVAQAPEPQPPVAEQAEQTADDAAPGEALADAAGDIYTYRPAGRRDPFVSLLARGVDPGPEGNNLTGIGGLTTAEISVSGILETHGEFVAMVQGPDTRTFIVRATDRLYDGVITRITPQGLIILQEVNDPLSLVKQREVQKNLRAAEETQ